MGSKKNRKTTKLPEPSSSEKIEHYKGEAKRCKKQVKRLEKRIESLEKQLLGKKTEKIKPIEEIKHIDEVREAFIKKFHPDYKEKE